VGSNPSWRSELIVMLPIVIQIERKDGTKVSYLKKTERYHKSEIRDRQHKCRIKETIYGGVFGYYCEGMDFTLSLSVGSKITIDNREDFGFTVKGK